MGLCEYWTLARSDSGTAWTVVSIETRAEGDHHLDEEIVASPWSDTQRLEDESLTELAVEDGLPPGFTTADLAVVSFDGTAREQALDLSLADARFAPDVLEAAARRAVAAWAEAVDGDDAALLEVATPEAVSELLYGGDASRKTRVVVRGPRVRADQDPGGGRVARAGDDDDRGGIGRPAVRGGSRHRGGGAWVEGADGSLQGELDIRARWLAFRTLARRRRGLDRASCRLKSVLQAHRHRTG